MEKSDEAAGTCSVDRELCSGWPVTPRLGCTCARGGGPRVLWVDSKALALLTMSTDPFRQGSQCTPKILASGELCFSRWMKD